MGGTRRAKGVCSGAAALLAICAPMPIASGEPLLLDFAVVPAADVQPGGPAYDYRISRYEVSNTQFIAFLNDALLNLDNQRGRFMYFDTSSGDVYVHSQATGATGTGGAAKLMFATAASGLISYDEATAAYLVEPGFEDHPATGMSWYGAVKFCNWLTLQVGLPDDQRCYTEAASTNLGGWHPVTISDAAWATRDLTDAERIDLNEDYLGYRLPMDAGAQQASLFNEWYKAAAYDPEAPDSTRVSPLGQVVAPDHWLFGIGRDLAAGADANFLGSGDPFEDDDPGTTPAGFFDGVNQLTDLSLTRDTNNRYGLYDLTGNVWEWLQDQGDVPTLRRYRGGGWQSPASFVENTSVSNDRPDATGRWIGLRIAQADLHFEPVVAPEESEVTTFSGPLGGPFAPLSTTFTITSQSPDPLDWEVDSSAAWLDIDGALNASGTLAPFGEITLTVVPNTVAEEMDTLGTYTASLTFSFAGERESFTDAIRTVKLALAEELEVTPTSGFSATGPYGGPFFPNEQIYTLTNTTDEQLHTCVTASEDWVLINGGTYTCGTLAPELSTDITVSLRAEGVNALAAGETHGAIVEFKDQESGAVATRQVVVRVGLAPLTVTMAIVPETDIQPSGPAHSFRIGKYEVTNQEFAAFLNDAMFNMDNPRGWYMFHDTDSGDVFIHTQQTGSAGGDGSGTLMFDASDGDRITFEEIQYRVEPGAEREPVVGVSWYGALKFCNWLTIHQGIAPGQRAYTEGPGPDDWLPLAEAATLIDLAGYRLPMDGQSDGAGLYDEWYKAASYRGVDADDNAVFGALYGFGRDTLDGPDANYSNSGDPFDDGVTPVGWFDGVHLLAGGATQTNNTANGYRLYDLCGNVSEWIQDVGDEPSMRATRGGHWQNVVGSPLLDNLHRESDLPDSTRAFTGFRIVQKVPPVSISVGPSCAELTPCEFVSSGPVGGRYTTAAFEYTLTADGSQAANQYTVASDVGWLTLNAEGQSAGGLVTPGAEVGVSVALNEQADLLAAPTEPAIAMGTVPAEEVQPNGPLHSFRVAVFETTKQQFVEFLNDALASPTNRRGQYMYFDTDTGDVYINPTSSGQQGSGPAKRSILMFAAEFDPHITFDEDTGEYLVADGFESHPVTGVSWFGALKYCNWLSLESLLAVADLAYVEGPAVGDWHAATISTTDWWGTEDTVENPTPLPEARDLDVDERAALVNDYAGFRLPMDSGLSSAGRFNEWYKAAAWNGTANTAFGFGRDILEGPDANYLDSGDPFETIAPGTSPVGFFEGNNQLADETVTRDSQNHFALYDITGNVAEWVQDRTDLADRRAVRGGHFGLPAESAMLGNDSRESLPADSTSLYLGFRVVQSQLDHLGTLTFADVTTGESITREVRLLLHEPMSVAPETGFQAAGMYGGPFANDSKRYTLLSTSATPMDWRATVTQPGPRWLDVNGGAVATGTLTESVEAIVDVQVNPAGAYLSPGEYSATVEFKNQTTGYAVTRDFELTVTEALVVTPSTSFRITSLWGVPLDPPAEESYVMNNLSGSPIAYTVSAGAEWITLDDGVSVTGVLEPVGDAEGRDAVTVTAKTNDTLADVPVGTHAETISFRNVGAGTESTRTIELTVTDPLVTSPLGDGDTPNFSWMGHTGGPFEPSARPMVYTLENVAEYAIACTITSDVDWLHLNGQASFDDTLLPGFSLQINLSITQDANTLNAGRYPATLSFANSASGHTQTRAVALTVFGELAVTPLEEFEAAGRAGLGPFTPTSKAYTLTVPEDGSTTVWTVSVAPWVLINGGPSESAGGILEPGKSAYVIASIDPLAAAGLTVPNGASEWLHKATLAFQDGQGRVVERSISLTVVDSKVSLEERLVSADIAQPQGPAYPFMMAAHHTTNAAFAAFLNDARVNPDHPRGRYLFHDLDTGSVYVNDQESGVEGTEAPSATLTTLIYDVSVGRIEFDNGVYVPEPGLEDHPVVGVTWYGALKYCNWLTIDQGVLPDRRCYTEDTGANLLGWRPSAVGEVDWAARDLNDTERNDQVSSCRGFRLPMDDGYNNVDPAADTAGTYNEWYKAAAWNNVAQRNTTYGFGRDAIAGADANFSNSGDPFDNGTTPVGFFDGRVYNFDGSIDEDQIADPGDYQTAVDGNGFGLFDMTGNVYHWLQGRYSTHPDSISRRTLRGGSWDSPPGSVTLRTGLRTSTAPDFASAWVGFRVVRSLPAPGDVDQDGDVDLFDFVAKAECLTGPFPESGLSLGCGSIDLDMDDDFDLADYARFQNAFTGSK